MNKSDVVEYIAKCAGVTEPQAGRSIDCYHMAIQRALKKRETVTLVGFGTFEVATRKPRKARNPRTGEEIRIPARNVPKFRPGKVLKDAVRR